MRIYIQILFSILVAIPAFAGTQIISDFDDTIKRSNIVNGGVRTVGRAILPYKAYRGIPTLYQEMMGIYNSDDCKGEKSHCGAYVLSASPGVVKPLIKLTLKSYDIAYAAVFTRSFREIGATEKKIKYKLGRIEYVLNKHPEDKVILLGDNIEADHEVYLQIERKDPKRVAAIYIRKVYDEILPEKVNGFYTAFEVAAKEYEAKRLTLIKVKTVYEAIMSTSSKKMYQVIPYYAYCPVAEEEFNLSQVPELRDMQAKLVKKVINYCANKAREED